MQLIVNGVAGTEATYDGAWQRSGGVFDVIAADNGEYSLEKMDFYVGRDMGTAWSVEATTPF